MPSLQHHHLLLSTTLLILSISVYSTADSPSFAAILRSHGLPIGVVPNQINSFTVDPSTGNFQINLQQACNAKFENRVHYDYNVTGVISYGQIAELSGMSSQELFLWFPVKEIKVDVPSSGLIYFDVGGVVFKQFSLSLFESPPECVDVESIQIDQDLLIISSIKQHSLQDGMQKTRYPRSLKASL